MTKRLRAPNAKPGELKMQWGKLPGDCPDMCFAWGDGCSKRDGNFLHYVLASARPTHNRDEHGRPMFDKSVLEQLDERGYDLTTLRFSIRKKPSNAKLTGLAPGKDEQ
jgi:hypothetical protein